MAEIKLFDSFRMLIFLLTYKMKFLATHLVYPYFQCLFYSATKILQIFRAPLSAYFVFLERALTHLLILESCFKLFYLVLPFLLGYCQFCYYFEAML